MGFDVEFIPTIVGNAIYEDIYAGSFGLILNGTADTHTLCSKEVWKGKLCFRKVGNSV
jgi:hypothetical protein